jgi:hypothetical protein
MDLVRRPERWSELKAAARRYVEAERSWNASVARYDGVYARILQPANRA